MVKEIFGEVITKDPTARVIPTAEFINPYACLTPEQQEAYMREVEPPTIPKVEEERTT